MASTRRDFLGILGALAASGVGAWQPKDKCRQFVLHECFIAGFRYHEGPDLLAYLKAGDELQLIAEPGNPYDEWAVRIEHHKSHIGYLPRSQNQPISRLLQQDVPVACRIASIDADAVPWEAVRVQVSISVDANAIGASHA